VCVSAIARGMQARRCFDHTSCHAVSQSPGRPIEMVCMQAPPWQHPKRTALRTLTRQASTMLALRLCALTALVGSVWGLQDEVPAGFDCKMRSLAMSFAQQIQPIISTGQLQMVCRCTYMHMPIVLLLLRWFVTRPTSGHYVLNGSITTNRGQAMLACCWQRCGALLVASVVCILECVGHAQSSMSVLFLPHTFIHSCSHAPPHQSYTFIHSCMQSRTFELAKPPSQPAVQPASQPSELVRSRHHNRVACSPS
jgi:hypothetical protein